MAQHAVRADQRNIRAQRPQRSERPHADAGQARRADLPAEGVDRIVAVCERRRDLGRVRHDRQPVPQGEQARRAKVPVAVHLDHIPCLREIRKTVSVPLVLHGGSGLSDDDFRNTVAGGISKINVFTDVILAAKRAIAEHPDAGYTDLNLLAEDAMVEATVRKLELFGGCGKG